MPANAHPTGYYQYGADFTDQTDHWYDFAFQDSHGAVINGNVIDLYYVDGEVGDHDLVANGSIMDPGGPISAITAAADWQDYK